MKKKHIALIITVFALGIINSCSDDFLDIQPNGSLDQLTLTTRQGVDNLLIGAYAVLDGVSDNMGFDQWDATSTNWLWGSVRGLEANKGSDAGDQPDMNPVQTYSETATNNKINSKWRILYEGVSRCNSVIINADIALEAGNITEAQHATFVMQAKALRGFYHFEAWRFWQKIPYLDETTDPITVTNTEDPRDKIIADLTAGTALPADMDQIGRFNKTVCQVLLAKAQMQMFQRYDEALALLLEVETSGTKPNGDPIGLAPTFGEIFDIANRNGIEAIYTVQYSVNDGSGGANAGGGEVLNFPYKGNNGSPGGCCGFFIPNQELVNTFRTVGGLPLPNFTFDTPAEAVKNDQGIPGGSVWDPAAKYAVNQGCTVYDPANPYKDLGYVCIDTNNIKGANPLTSPSNWALRWTEDVSQPVDPRLDWTVGRRGIPFWDWGVHTGGDWIRDQSYSGPYTAKKQVFKKSQQGQFTEVGNWTSGWTSNGYRMIRFADVLLMIAECNIFKASPDLATATEYINKVRARATNPDGFVKEDDDATVDAATYEIVEYPATFATEADALYALQIERKLELGLEGHRFFDLQRWQNQLQNSYGVDELNRVLNYQKTLTWGTALYGSATVGAEDILYPIPQRQIDLSNGNITER